MQLNEQSNPWSKKTPNSLSESKLDDASVVTHKKSELHKQPLVGVANEQARLERLQFLNGLGHQSAHYTISQLTAHEVKGNIESFLGTMPLPVGLVGPIGHQAPRGRSGPRLWRFRLL